MTSINAQSLITAISHPVAPYSTGFCFRRLSAIAECDSVFEDVGAAGYYIREAGYRLESVLLTVQGDSAAASPHSGFGENEIE